MITCCQRYEAIAEYLLANVDFFERHASVLARLKLPHQRGSAAISLVERQVLVLRSFELDPVPVSVVHVGHGRLPLKLRAFLDFATPRIRASLGAVAPRA